MMGVPTGQVKAAHGRLYFLLSFGVFSYCGRQRSGANTFGIKSSSNGYGWLGAWHPKWGSLNH